MPKFRKKPVEIEAYQLDGRITNQPPFWLWQAINRGEVTHPAGEPLSCVIRTLEGEMTAHEGDWIIQGVKGEIYPCKPDIFEATYEPVAPTRNDEAARGERSGDHG